MSGPMLPPQFSALEQLTQMNKKLDSMSAFFTQIESATNTAPTEAQ